jgi:hypothetical protein
MSADAWSKLGSRVWEWLQARERGHGHGHGHHGACGGCGRGLAWACHSGCCTVPETCCPPRCAGKLDWKIHRGAVPEATVEVRNVGLVARTFQLSATPLAGVGAGAARLSVTPASARLEPGQSIIANVKLEDSVLLRSCQAYRAEVLIRGSWEQCVEVFVDVTADPFDKVGIAQSGSLGDKAFHPHTCKEAIDWKIERHVVPEAAISVHNAGRAVQSFQFEPQALVGLAAGAARLVVWPDSLQLGAGQSGVARVKLQGSVDLSPGQSYHGTVRVLGYYEQNIETRTRVEPDPTGHVEVEQGEAPTRIRAHHWYDHFQCTDACQFPPAPMS